MPEHRCEQLEAVLRDQVRGVGRAVQQRRRRLARVGRVLVQPWSHASNRDL